MIHDRTALERELRDRLHALAPSPRPGTAAAVMRLVEATPQRRGGVARLFSSVGPSAWARAGAVAAVVGLAFVAGVLIGQVRPPVAIGPSPSPSTSSPASAPPAEWQEPEAYSFVMESTCGERDPIGLFRVYVSDGVATDFDALDASARRYVGSYPAEEMPTLGDMLDSVAEARSATETGPARPGASPSLPVVVLRTDPVDGHPLEVRIDWLPSAQDDEECYLITEYEPDLGPATGLAWSEPRGYEFVLESSCGERNGLGSWWIRVSDGRVVEYRVLDGADLPLDELPTIGVLLNRAALASTTGGGAGRASPSSDPIVTLESDPADGHPTFIHIDWIPEAIDDEECHRITAYEGYAVAPILPLPDDPRDDPREP